MQARTAAPESATESAQESTVGIQKSGIRWRNAAAPLSLIGLGLAGTAYFGLKDQHESGLIPPCLILSLTGWDCPLCGGSRAIHDLTRGNLLEAANHNIVAVALVPIAVVVLAMWAWRRLRPESGRAGPGPTRAPSKVARFVTVNSIVVLAVLALLIFAVIRNIPAFSILGSTVG